MEDEKKTISVAYRPGIGDAETTEAYGRRFRAGEFINIPIEFASQVRGNPTFQVEGEKTHGDDDEHLIVIDDPNYPKDAGTEADISFDEAVALETAKEYGTSDPDLAETLRTARQHNRDLVGMNRVEAETEIKKRRGRPPKDAPPVDDEAKAWAEKIEADQAQIEREKQAERDAEAQRLKALRDSQA